MGLPAAQYLLSIIISLILGFFLVHPASASSYVTTSWKYTECLSDCTAQACPDGFGHLSGSCHWSWDCTEPGGNWHNTCGLAWQHHCKCYQCAKGYYHSTNSGCRACAAGKIQSSNGGTSCNSCPAGKKSNGEPRTQCSSCEPGSYTSGAGSGDECIPCPAGKYTDVGAWGQTACTSCGKGKYQPDTGAKGAALCLDCPVGKYTASTTASSCSTCPSGKSTNGLGTTSVSGCVDEDECAGEGANEDCDQVCTNSDGSYSCSCLPGFTSGATCGIKSLASATFQEYTSVTVSRDSLECPGCWDIASSPIVRVIAPSGLATTDDHIVKYHFVLTFDGNNHESTHTLPSNADLDTGYNVGCNAHLPSTGENSGVFPTAGSPWSCSVSFSSTYKHSENPSRADDDTVKISVASPVTDITVENAPCGCNPDDDNGAAINFQVVQVSTDTMVYFKFLWTDGSTCDRAFVFYRQESGGSLTHIGTHESLNKYDSSRPQCGAFYDPESDQTTDPITDDTPGSARTYCVEAVGYEYTGPRVCETVNVLWMAKVQGNVQTSTGRGVDGVSFRWHFQDDPSVGGFVEDATGADGSFSFSITHETLTETSTVVMVCPEKTSAGVAHEFQFNGETFDCAPLTAHHLGVKNVIFKDISEFTVEGNVYFPASAYIASQCGSAGVTVCARSAPDPLNSSPPPPPVCEQSDAAGAYSLSLAHGSEVYISSSLNNHTFTTFEDGSKAEIHISSLVQSITEQDFIDTTTVSVGISLHGGRCKIFLGTFKVEVNSLNSCFSREVWQDVDQVRELVLDNLPALDYEINLLQVNAISGGVSGDEIKNYMDSRTLSQQRVLLHEKTHDKGEVLYQYEPLPVLVSSVSAPPRGSCSDHKVVTSWRSYNVSFDAYQDFKSAGQCHDVDGYWFVEDNTNPATDCSYLTRGMERDDVEEGSYCNPVMRHETQTVAGEEVAEVTRSYIDLKVVPGAANPENSGTYPYQRTIVANFGFDEAGSRETMIVPLFIEGEKLLGAEFSMDFPQSLPILIIHDPPGGGSSAFFKEGTSVSTSMSMHTDVGGGVNIQSTIKGGYEQKEELCLGVGVTKCSDVLTTTATAYAKVGASVSGLSMTDDGWSFSLSDSTAYSTTGYSGLTGRDADAVLTTAINIKFGMSKEVTFNEETCAGEDRDSVQWMPNSPDSGEVVVYKTIYDIEQVLIPSLQRSLQAEREADEPSEITIYNLNAAIEGWQDVIDYNDEIHANAELAASVSIDPDAEEPADLDLDNVPGSSNPDAKRISWSGGGQAYSFSTSTSSSQSHSFSRNVAIDSSLEAGFEIGMGLLGFTASVGGALTATFHFHTGSSESSSVSTTTETGFTLSDPELGDSFVTEVLTDPIFGTPLFRTLSGASRCIWEPGTVRREQIDLQFENGGKHLELMNLTPDSLTPVTVRVCNNSPEEGVFDYKLNMIHSSNPNALVIKSLGEPITEPRDYIVPPGCTNVVLEVERGPIAYTYSEVKLRMAVPCESGFWNGNGMARMFDHSDITFTMNYLRPCPRVTFALTTADDEAFIHNIESTGEEEEVVMLIVRNDQYDELKWEDSDRLQNVFLQYRKSARDDEIQIQQQWVTGTVTYKKSDGTVVEYDQHDSFGFIRVYWDVSSVPDGKWEVRVVADCAFSSDDTKALDQSSTMVLPGLIDRQSPGILGGFSEPVDGEWDIGDDISVITAENIDWEKGFVLRGEAINGGYSFGSEMVDTLAVGRSLMLAFSARMDLGRLMGGKVSITVDDFYDMAGNKNSAPYTWSFRMKQLESLDVNSKVTGILLTEVGTECVENSNSGACTGFDALFRTEVSTLLQVSTGRIVDTTYTEVWVTPKNATAAGFTSLRCVEAGFTITPSASAFDKASWELSSLFVELLQDPEEVEDYSALSKVYFKEPNNGGVNEGWRNENGGIGAKVFFDVLDEKGRGGEDSGILGLSKKHLFVAGTCICAVLVSSGAAYIIFKRTVHKRHKKQHEIEDLEVELEVEAVISGYKENLDLEHMTREQIRKTTAVKKAMRHGSQGVGGDSWADFMGGSSNSNPSHLHVAFAGDMQENPMRTHPELHPPAAPTKADADRNTSRSRVTSKVRKLRGAK